MGVDQHQADQVDQADRADQVVGDGLTADEESRGC